MNKVTRRGALTIASFVPFGTAAVWHAKAAVDGQERAGHNPPKLPGPGIRVSNVEGDVGERLYAELMADGKKIEVYLDDVEQPYCVTADEQRGYVVRFAMAKDGGPLVSDNRILMETLFGHVRVVIS